MSSLFRHLLVVVGLVAAAVLLAACGGGNGDGLSLDEYFQRMQGINETAEERSDRLEEESLEGAEDIEAFQEYFDGFEVIFGDALNDVKDLEPPSEARDAHNRFVDALEEAQAELSDIADKVGRAETFSDLEALMSDLAAPGFEGVDDACLELQEIADENDIAVDLDCGAEES